jgi:integrase
MLNHTRIQGLKPKTTPYKVADRDGLYLLIPPSGAKGWRFDYRFAGRRKTLSFGPLKDVTLAKARQRLADARAELADGRDPSVVRRAEHQRVKTAAANTFEVVAREWLAKQIKLAPATVTKITWLFEGYLFPQIGRRPIGDVEAPELLGALQHIERRGRHETAHRTKQIAGQVFRYAIATGRATRDPSWDLRGALTPVKTTHHAAVTEPAAVGALLRAIEGFHGAFHVWQALRLAPLLFVRPGELRRAEWAEIDEAAKLWRIPAAKMKAREPHLVPLSRQALELLRELRPLTGRDRYLFPSVRTKLRPMSDGTMNAALRRLGYGHNEMTAHGFRSLASTRLNEMGFRADVIERQLAHADKDTTRAAYNRADYLTERVDMMQRWSDELDRLREYREAGAA